MWKCTVNLICVCSFFLCVRSVTCWILGGDEGWEWWGCVSIYWLIWISVKIYDFLYCVTLCGKYVVGYAKFVSLGFVFVSDRFLWWFWVHGIDAYSVHVGCTSEMKFVGTLSTRTLTEVSRIMKQITNINSSKATTFYCWIKSSAY